MKILEMRLLTKQRRVTSADDQGTWPRTVARACLCFVLAICVLSLDTIRVPVHMPFAGSVAFQATRAGIAAGCHQDGLPIRNLSNESALNAVALTVLKER